MKSKTSWWQKLNPFVHRGAKKRQETRLRQQRRCQVEPLEHRVLLSINLGALPHQVIGSQDANYAEGGSDWQSWPDASAYQGTVRYHVPGDGADTATFAFNGLGATKTYQLFAAYDASGNHAGNAPFMVTDGTRVLNTVSLNEQATPNQASLDGVNYQSLGVFQTTTGSVDVLLSDLANGDVVANAVCAVEVTPPATPPSVVDNADPGHSEAGGGWLGWTSADNYQGDCRYAPAGTGDSTASWAFAGLDPTKSYQVYATWNASGNHASNAPYTILDGISSLATVQMNQQNAPSDTTIDGWQWQSLGTYQASSGNLVVQLSNNANGDVVADAVRIVEVTPPTTPPSVIDNSDVGYAETGSTWLSWSDPSLYNGDCRYAPAGAGQNTAKWTFNGLDPTKTYQVYATWNASGNHASNAPYTIYDGTSARNIVQMNQQNAPSDATIDNQAWESLGTHQAGSGSLVVQLSDDANGYVVANAIRLVEVTPPATPPSVIDNSDAAYSESGSSWLGWNDPSLYNGGCRYASAGTGQNTASWTFANVPVGVYQVYATWNASGNHADNAPFTISDGTSALATVTANQRLAPADFTAGGQAWASLGTYTIQSGELLVSLSDNTDGDVVADAVRLSAVAYAPTGLAATAASSNEIDLSWTNPNSPALGVTFSVQRATDVAFTQNVTTVLTTAANATSCSDMGVVPGTTYYYRVMAVTTAALTPYGATASAAAPAATALPSGWADADVGGPWVAGSATYSNGVFTISGGGSDIWNNADQYNFVSQPASGDQTLTVRVTSQTNTNSWAKAGLMFRDSAAAGAMHVDIMTTPGNGVSMQWRNATGGASDKAYLSNVPVPTPANPIWLKLIKNGDNYAGYYSLNGTTWTQVGSATVAFSNATYLTGLAVTGHNSWAASTATLDNFAQTATAVACAPLPAGWTDADIGGPSPTGSATYADGVYTLSAGGADIGGAADQFHFASQTVCDGQTMIARVTSLGNSDGWVKAGAMFRDSAAAGAMYVGIFATPANGIAMQWRTSTGGSTSTTTLSGVAAPSASNPVWLKLVRTAGVYTGYYSADGATWTQVGSASVSFDNGAYLAGLALGSHNNGTATTATIDNVSVAAALPPAWSDADIGSPSPSGSANFAGGVYTLSGGGTDIAGASDQFNFASQVISGDQTFVTRVTSQDNTSDAAKVGVMFRDSAAANSRFVDLVATPASGVLMQWRSSTGGTCAAATVAGVPAPSATSPVWLKLVRSGNTYSGYYSPDGTTWTQVGSTSVSFSNVGYLAGLAVCSQTAGASSTATLDNVSVGSNTSATLPAPLSDADIGSPAIPGSAQCIAGVYTTTGNGADIWGTSDQFNFVSQSTSGDQTLVARVTSQTNTDPWAKAGVMFRDSTAAGAINVGLFATPGNGVAMQWRTSTGGGCGIVTAGSVAGPGDSSPVWIKLVKTGSQFVGYWSPDGATWTQVGSTSLNFTNNTYLAGMAVCSHTTSASSTATLDNYSLTAAATGPLPSVWADADIGPAIPGGSAGYVNGVYTLSCSGGDIWGASDQFNFASQTASGDQTLVTRVTALTDTNIWAKAGLMFRDTTGQTGPNTSAGAMFVDLVATPGSGVSLQWRNVTGGQCGQIVLASPGAPTASSPVWLELVKTGNTYTGYWSSDGARWNLVGSTTVNFSNSTYLAGLCVSSHVAATAATASFDNVSLAPSASENLALSAPVMASSNTAGDQATSAVDGNVSTNWTSGSGTGTEWLQVDLGASYPVSDVRLNWGAAYASAYQVQISNDAQNWTTLYSTTAAAGGVQNLSGLSGSGQYVRLCLTAGPQANYTLNEVAVYPLTLTWAGGDGSWGPGATDWIGPNGQFQTWQDGADAVFAAPPAGQSGTSTVSIFGSVSPHAITFTGGNYVLQSGDNSASDQIVLQGDSAAINVLNASSTVAINIAFVLPDAGATINVASARSTITINGVISGGSAGATFEKVGQGSLVLGAQNTYLGGTEFVGPVTFAAVNALPATTIVQLGDPAFGDATMDLDGFNQTIAGLITAPLAGVHRPIFDRTINSSTSAATLTVVNTGDDDYVGSFAGNLALAKYGSGQWTVGGDNTNSGDVSVYDGTLNVTGSFTANVQTVAGYGNPQVTGIGDPEYWVVNVGGGSGPTSGGDSGNFFTVSNSVEADSWQEAVEKALAGVVYTPQNSNGPFYFGDYYNSNNPLDGAAFQIGTVGDLEQSINGPVNGSPYYYDPTNPDGREDYIFNLDDQHNGVFDYESEGITSDQTQVIVFEDCTGMSWNDMDYDDYFCVVNATEVTPVSVSINAPSQPVIEGNSITVSAAVSGASPSDLSYYWSSSDGQSSSGQSSWTFTPHDDGTDTISLTAYYDGTPYFASTAVQVQEAPMSVTLNTPQINTDGSVSVTATVSDGANEDASPGYYYTWSVNKNGNTWQSPSSISSSLQFTPDGPGTYTVYVAAHENDNDASSPLASTTVTITAPTASIVRDWPSSVLGGDQASFHVVLSFAVPKAVTVQYHTVDGTATAGNEYVVTSGSFVVDANQTSSLNNTSDPTSFTISTRNDTKDIQSESFQVQPVTPGSGEYTVGSGDSVTVVPWHSYCTCSGDSISADGTMIRSNPADQSGDTILMYDDSANKYQVVPAINKAVADDGIVIEGLGKAITFTRDIHGTITPVDPGQGSLSSDGSTYAAPDGTKYVFAGDPQLVAINRPNGQNDTLIYTSGQLTEHDTPVASGVNQVFKYTYDSVSGVLTGVTNSYQEGLTTVPVGSSQYTYYVSGSQGGSAGDIETVSNYGSAGQLLSTSYYRYYKGPYITGTGTGLSGNEGTNGEVKFVLGNAALNRLMSYYSLTTTSQLEGLTDAQVYTFADSYNKYDLNGRVIEEDSGASGCSCAGGIGITTYQYATSSFAGGQNNWAYQSIQTRGDGSTVTTFDNYQGEELLQDVWNGLSGTASQHWVTVDRYDAMGNLVETVHPSAMVNYAGGPFNGYNYAAGYFDTSCPDLMDSDGNLSHTPYLSPTAGLIDVNTYYASTTSGISPTSPGGVAGYAWQSFQVQGATVASAIIAAPGTITAGLQTTTDYIADTLGGITSYFTHSSTSYQCSNGSSTETTSYGYTFASGGSVTGPVIQTQTTTLPIVSTTQNGSGSANSSSDVYNTFGQVVWSQDAAGYVNFTRYDQATGAVIEQIQDVNPSYVSTANGFTTQEVALWSDLPTSVPADAGKKLITTSEVDSQGRTIWQQDPAGNVTCTVYNDALQETITYPGWHYVNSTVGWQTTGPIQVSRQDTSGNYSESLSYTWTGTTGAGGVLPTATSPGGHAVPTGSEFLTAAVSGIVVQENLNSNFGPYACIQSLSRDLMNSSGQVTQSLQYFSTSGMTYSPNLAATGALGTKGVDYLETDSYYDKLGRFYSTHSSDGTVQETFFDAQGNVTSTWKGSSDVPNVSVAACGYYTDPRGFRYWVSHNPTTTAATVYGMNMYLVSTSTFDADGNQLSVAQYHSTSLSQWANTVLAFSSQYDDGTSDWHATQALGAPNVLADGDNPNAWAPLLPDDPAASPYETLTLGYSTPVYASDVSVYESYNSGFVTNIEVRNASTGQYVSVMPAGGDTAPTGPWTTEPVFADAFAPTAFPVDAVRITVNTRHVLGDWEEVDAVQLQGVPAPSVTTYGYDFRDRQIMTVNPPDAQNRVTYTLTQYDNAGEATETQQYQFNGSLASLPGLISGAQGEATAVPLNGTDLLLSQNVTAYDSQGRVYESRSYSVAAPEPVTGLVADGTTATATVAGNQELKVGDVVLISGSPFPNLNGQFTITAVSGNTFSYPLNALVACGGGTASCAVPIAYLATDTWYDSRGNVVKSLPQGSSTYTLDQYNSADQLAAQYAGTDTNTGYPNLSNIAGTMTVYTQSEYKYDNDGQQIFAIARNRNASTSGTGALTSSTGRSTYTAYWYDQAGRQTTAASYGTTAPGGQEQRPSGNPPTQNSIAMVTTTSYDDVAHSTTVTDPLNRATRTVYDLAGRVTTAIQNYVYGGSAADQNSTTTTVYNQLGQVYQRIAPGTGSNVTTYSYDPTFGRLQQVATPSPTGSGTATTTYAYDLQGETTAVTDPMSRVTATAYDALGRPIATAAGNIAAPSGSTWSFTQLAPNAAGVYTLYVQYPSLNPPANLIGDYHASDPQHSSLTIGPVSTAEPLGAGWYALGTITLPSGDTSTSLTVSYVGTPPDTQAVNIGLLQQDSATVCTVEGQAYTTADALNHSTTYGYDGYGREQTVTDANGHTTTYAYYNNGDLQSEQDPDGNTTTYFSDALDRVWKDVTPTGTTITTYDGGNISTVVDADNRTTQYTYDQYNRKTAEYWYAAGVTPLSDRSNAYEVLSYPSYDLDNELIGASDTSSATSQQSTNALVYDGLGRVKADSQWSTGMAQTVNLSSQYNSAGNRTQLSANLGGTVNTTTGQVTGGTADFANTYQYYADNAMQQVSQASVTGGDGVDAKTVNFTYNADGQFAIIDRFAGTTPVRVAKSIYAYDNSGRTTSLTHTAPNGTSTYVQYGWTYNADNQAQSFTNSAYAAENVGSYVYDADGQLTGATPSGTANAANSFVNNYDANGNVTDGSAAPAAAPAPPANSTMLSVTNTNSSGAGSLAYAMQQAGGSGNYIIQFSSLFYSATQTISLSSQLVFNSGTNVWIVGPGSSLLTVNCASGSFWICSGATASISGLTISGETYGTRLDNRGTLTLSSCTFSGNGSPDSNGGAIANEGPLTITSCSFINNSGHDGGVICSGSPMTITSSLFYNNTSNYEGGAIQNNGPLSITSCTFKNNTALVGGAINNYGAPGATVSIVSSTISGNTAYWGSSGGGIKNDSDLSAGTISIVNSIVAGNTSSGAPDISDSSGAVTTQNSLVQSTAGWTPPAGTIVNVNPLLGSLANNGAPTQTMNLLPGSPIIGKGIGAYQTKIGTGNEVLFDGTYTDTYDAAGNLTEHDSTADHFTYSYDNRNRLIKALDYVLATGLTTEVDYRYDVFNRLTGRTVSGTGAGANAGTQRFVYDGTNRVLAFDVSSNLTDRYLWGPAVDQVLADENYAPGARSQHPSLAGTTLWALADNQGTVRDVVTDSGALEQHIAYSPFGAQVSISTTVAPTVAAFAFGYTGTYTDVITGDQLHGVRWYDPQSQRWITQDWAGLGPDSNPYRYCGNGPTDATDPSGEDDTPSLPRSLTKSEKCIAEMVFYLVGHEDPKEFRKFVKFVSDDLKIVNNPKMTEDGYFTSENPVKVTVAKTALSNGAEAITLGNRIYTKEFLYSADRNRPCAISEDEVDAPYDAAIVGHELTHVVQQLRDSDFYVEYMRQYALNRKGGMRDAEAYNQISYELTAYAVQHALYKFFKDKTNRKLFDDLCCSDKLQGILDGHEGSPLKTTLQKLFNDAEKKQREDYEKEHPLPDNFDWRNIKDPPLR